jgi:hypothetical protein
LRRLIPHSVITHRPASGGYDGRMSWKIALASSLALASCMGSEPDCNTECVPGISVTTQLDVPETALSGATVTFCQNSACSTATLPAQTVGNLTETDSAGAFVASIQVIDMDAHGMFDPYASSVSAVLDDGTYTDGDVYTLTIVDASGTTLFSKDLVVSHYEIVSSCALTCQELQVDF